MWLFLTFLLIIFTGLPIAFAFGVAGLFFLLNFTNMSPELLVSTSFASIDSFPIMAVPFFIFAGDIMRYGGVSKKLISFTKAMLHKSKSALGNITILSSAFFGAISGSAAATVAAIGGIMIPEMYRYSYKKNYAAALASAAGYLGILIPPSVPLVIYGVASGESIGKLFLGGIGPGIIATIAFMLINMKLINNNYEASQTVINEPHEKVSFLKEFLETLPGLFMPVIILGGIYLGIFTATEAAAVAIFYGLIISLCVYREIKIKDILNIAVESALTSSTILIIIALAGFFGRLMTLLQIPAQIAALLLNISSSPVILIILINVFLLILGMLMETSTAILITTPILLPVAIKLGFDPVHFGVMMVFNLAIGLITPPMALNLFVGSQISGLPVSKLTKPILPFVFISIVVLAVVIFVPQLTMFLPNLLIK